MLSDFKFSITPRTVFRASCFCHLLASVKSQCLKRSSKRHFVEDNFEDATDHIAFNHDDERSVVLISDVAQRDRVVNDLFFYASDFHKWAFVGESDESCALPVE